MVATHFPQGDDADGRVFNILKEELKLLCPDVSFQTVDSKKKDDLGIASLRVDFHEALRNKYANDLTPLESWGNHDLKVLVSIFNASRNNSIGALFTETEFKTVYLDGVANEGSILRFLIQTGFIERMKAKNESVESFVFLRSNLFINLLLCFFPSECKSEITEREYPATSQRAVYLTTMVAAYTGKTLFPR